MSESELQSAASRRQTVLAASRSAKGSRAAHSDPRGHFSPAAERWRSSDTKRFYGVFSAALAAAVAILLVWYAAPFFRPPSRGRLALPHREAGLSCEACHQQDASPQLACTGCHGAHPSRRPAHRALQASGVLKCNDCHDVHGSDGGLRFDPGNGAREARATRYGLAGEQEFTPAASLMAAATVPLVSAGLCRSCHDLNRPEDPISSCFRGGALGTSADALVLCFDEHRPAMATSAAAREAGVCVSQHQSDRYLAWELARTTVAKSSLSLASTLYSPAWLLLFGGLGGGLGFFIHRGAQYVRGRRRQCASVAPVVAALSKPRRRLPQIDAATCLGCHACVDVCPYDVFSIKNYVAVVTRPEACCGAALCEQICPNGSLALLNGERDPKHPSLSESFESSDMPGVFLAGDISGVSLIKNAIIQGRRAVDGVCASLPAEHHCRFDLLIVGAGPAGISAALRAKERGLRFAVIEQDSVAQSIRSFPRGKLIFEQPLVLPRVGELWLRNCTKEELLGKWLRVIRQQQLPIREGYRFVGLDHHAAGFRVRIEPVGEETPRQFRLEAARVLLAIGRRGSARKLSIDIPENLQDKVFYHLADARSLAEKSVLVVGLGDVAMETGIALARQPGTHVTMSYRSLGFSRGRRRNIEELRRLIAAERITLVAQSALTGIARDSITLATPTGPRTIENDAVFVMIGCEPPERVLQALGIKAG